MIFSLFGAVKWLVILAIVASLGFGGYYVINMKANLYVAKSNIITLESSVQEQQKVIENKETEFKQITFINKELVSTVEAQNKEIDDLNKKFTINAKGQSRDLGAITRIKPKLINNIVNKATDDVNRCLEIITGSILKEGEINECENSINTIN